MSTSWMPSIKLVRDVCGTVSVTAELYLKGREAYYVYWKQKPNPPLSPREEFVKKVMVFSGLTALSCTVVDGVRNSVRSWGGPFSFSSRTQTPKKEGFESYVSQDPLNPQGGSVDEQILNQENNNSIINTNSSIEVPDIQVLEGIGTRNGALPNQIFRKSIKN